MFKYDFKKKLYLITDEKLIKRKNFIEKIKEACANGIDLIQIREKNTKLIDRVELCKEVVKVAHKFGAKVIINDDPQLALVCKADGVHIGKEDASISKARALLGEKAIIGVSCYGDIDLALRMEKLGADYVSFGNFYFSPTKPNEKIIPIDILRQAKERLKIPIVAIGGITEKNFQKLLQEGADAVCSVSALLKGKKIKKWNIKGG